MDLRTQLLRRNKAIATGMMIGAAILFVVARLQNGGGWEWLAAFAEAAMVGALADWFAVVALFRHPLGIPIPHTAIIRNKKNAIAENLAEFIRDRFLAPETMIAKLREQNVASRLATYLAAGTNGELLAAGVVRVLANSLSFIEDERVQKILRSMVANRVEAFDLSTSAASLVETLRNGNRHQAILDELLSRCAAWLAVPESQVAIARYIDGMITRDYPLLSVFIPNREQFSQGAGEKITARINDYLHGVSEDPDHLLRQKFDGIVTEFVTRLKTDQQLRSSIEMVKREAVQNPLLSDYVSDLGSDLARWLDNDLSRTDSQIRAHIAALITGLGKLLAEKSSLQDCFNSYLEQLVTTYGETARSAVARHISGTVQGWDHEEYVTEIELSIGSDLQFIRMNGTLVGGIIGLLLHGISLLLH